MTTNSRRFARHCREHFVPARPDDKPTTPDEAEPAAETPATGRTSDQNGATRAD